MLYPDLNLDWNCLCLPLWTTPWGYSYSKPVLWRDQQQQQKDQQRQKIKQPVSGRAEIGTQMIWLQGWAFKLYILCLQWFLLALLLLLSHFSSVWLCATPQTAAHQARPSLAFSRQKHWNGLPFPSPRHESEKWKWSHSVVSDSSRPHGLQPTRLLHPWDFPGKSAGVGCHCLLAQSTPKPKKKCTVSLNLGIISFISSIISK